MRIRMLRSALGSPDGTNVYHYEAGSNYLASDAHQGDGSYAASPLPLSNRLAALFVAEGWAEDTNAVAQEPASSVVASASVAAAPVEPVAEPAPVSSPEPKPAPTVADSATVAAAEPVAPKPEPAPKQDARE